MSNFVVLGVANAERDVLEIAEQRHVGNFGKSGHGKWGATEEAPS